MGKRDTARQATDDKMLLACKKLRYEHRHIHTQYLKVIALLRWPWLGEDAKMLRYTYSAGFA